jgi:hypothetical protein
MIRAVFRIEVHPSNMNKERPYLEQMMETSRRRNKEDLPIWVCSSGTMNFYRTSGSRLPFIFTFLVLIFRCSSFSVLHCHSFFWCVLPTTVPNTLTASVGSLHCHLTHSSPLRINATVSSTQRTVLRLP